MFRYSVLNPGGMIRHMTNSKKRKLPHQEFGAVLLEYALLCLLISFVSLIGIKTVGGSLQNGFQNLTDEVDPGAGGRGGH